MGMSIKRRAANCRQPPGGGRRRSITLSLGGCLALFKALFSLSVKAQRQSVSHCHARMHARRSSSSSIFPRGPVREHHPFISVTLWPRKRLLVVFLRRDSCKPDALDCSRVTTRLWRRQGVLGRSSWLASNDM